MKISAAMSSLAVVFVLAACSSSGGSGGLSAAEIKAMPVTTKMPTKGKAVYNGKSSETIELTNSTVTLRSNIQLEADFAASTMDATVSNINVSGGGRSIDINGQLTGQGDIVGNQFYVFADGTVSSESGTGYSWVDIFGDFKGSNAEAVEGTIIFEGDGGSDFTAGQ